MFVLFLLTITLCSLLAVKQDIERKENSSCLAACAAQQPQAAGSDFISSSQHLPSLVMGNLLGAAETDTPTVTAMAIFALATTTASQQVAACQLCDEEAMIDEMTEMLCLEINNMTEREIGEAFRDVIVTLFHKIMKFIVNKEELSRLKYNYDMGNFVMKKLHVVDNKSKPRWWLWHGEKVCGHTASVTWQSRLL